MSDSPVSFPTRSSVRASEGVVPSSLPEDGGSDYESDSLSSGSGDEATGSEDNVFRAGDLNVAASGPRNPQVEEKILLTIIGNRAISGSPYETPSELRARIDLEREKSAAELRSDWLRSSTSPEPQPYVGAVVPDPTTPEYVDHPTYGLTNFVWTGAEWVERPPACANGCRSYKLLENGSLQCNVCYQALKKCRVCDKPFSSVMRGGRCRSCRRNYLQ